MLQILEVDNVEVGVIVHHNKPDGTKCGVTAYWAWAKDCQIWTVVKRYPLTLTPSIVCTICGLHGFITDGQFN